MHRIAILVLWLAVSASAPAGEIYRCVGEDGSLVFSQQPCADDAERVRLSGERPTPRPGGIQPVQTTTEIRAVCRQAMNHLMAFLAEQARMMESEDDVEAAALLRSIADERGGVSEEDVEACYSDWSDPVVRGSWQCMAAARTQAARQDCVSNDLGRVFASFAFD